MEYYTTEIEQSKLLVDLNPSDQVLRIHDLIVKRKAEYEENEARRAKRDALRLSNKESFLNNFSKALNKQAAYFDDLIVLGPQYNLNLPKHLRTKNTCNDYAWSIKWENFLDADLIAKLDQNAEHVIIDWNGSTRVEGELINNDWRYKVMAVVESNDDEDGIQWIITHHCTTVETAVNYILEQLINEIHFLPAI